MRLTTGMASGFKWSFAFPCCPRSGGSGKMRSRKTRPSNCSWISLLKFAAKSPGNSFSATTTPRMNFTSSVSFSSFKSSAASSIVASSLIASVTSSPDSGSTSGMSVSCIFLTSEIQRSISSSISVETSNSSSSLVTAMMSTETARVSTPDVRPPRWGRSTQNG